MTDDDILDKMLQIDMAQTKRIQKLEKNVSELISSFNKLIDVLRKGGILK